MSIIEQLASSLERRDEIPNIELAKKIALSKNKKDIQELVGLLQHKSKDLQNDAIKVLYEIGARDPQLISSCARDFVDLLGTKNNRLQWGLMTALNSITDTVPDIIFSFLKKIIDAADKGSVITNDQCVALLIKLCSIKTYEDPAFTLLNERLLKSPANQLPMYAEQALPTVSEKRKALFLRTLNVRLDDLEKESKRKRVEKVIKKLRD